MIRVVLPHHLNTLAAVEGQIALIFGAIAGG
jgi:hypothetical protein